MNALATSFGILIGSFLLGVGLLTFSLIVHALVVRRREARRVRALATAAASMPVPAASLGTASIAEDGSLHMESLEEMAAPGAFLDGGFNYTIHRRREGAPRAMPNLGGFAEVPLLFYDREGSYLVLRRTLCLN